MSNDWHAAMKQQFDDILSTEIQYLVEDLFVSFTAIPRLIHGMFEIRAADVNSPVTQVKISKIVTETLAMRGELEAWYDRFILVVPPPSEGRSSYGDLLYPIVFYFSDVNTASIFCAYYAYMTVVHDILKTCGFGVSGSQEAYVAYFRDQICKSVEYIARGLLGPSRLAFPLHVAYKVGNPMTRRWIEGWLRQLSKRYGALTPRNFT